MKLKGSCHCGAVNFEVESKTPQPFMHCYCTICRKTQGGGGYAINIMGLSETFSATGTENVSIYRASMKQHDPKADLAGNMRHFCKTCGSHLWAWCPKYPTYIYPMASAIDTPLPVPIERNHIMLENKQPWVLVPPELAQKEHRFEHYPDEGIEEWHKKRKLEA
ncbi:hypothetical protein ABBQ38_014663 [Trebouxia sp. C0009 RCD-2024]